MSVTHRLSPGDKLASNTGFTLVELIVTVTIAGILLGIAIPSFIDTIKGNRLAASANDFLSALSLARSEAIKRGVQVSVESIGTVAGQWDSGWNVFVDINGNGVFNDNATAPLCEAGEDCLVRTYADLPTGYTFRVGATSAFKDFIAYAPSGFSTVSPSTDAFKLCSNSGTKQRTITIGATGRPSVADTTGTCP
jgi:type IV fimbrial biogenesis protein FimT